MLVLLTTKYMSVALTKYPNKINCFKSLPRLYINKQLYINPHSEQVYLLYDQTTIQTLNFYVFYFFILDKI